MEFAVGFAWYAGQRMLDLRTSAGQRKKKLDITDVTDADESINNEFIQAVESREGSNASVLGKEQSRNASTSRVWIIDPIDGTGEYINPSVPYAQRTSCVGIALLEGGVLTLSVVCNPFRKELFTAVRGGLAKLNGWIIRCSDVPLTPGAPYDYAHWDGAPYDLRGLENQLGKPRGVYSAIYQACEVARGRSVFAAFPGNTIHDIAPGALLVMQAGGLTVDLHGNGLDLQDLRGGALHSSTTAHVAALRAMQSL